MGDIIEYVPNMYATFGALVPPLVAIILALITKEVYSSLFIGIVIGGAGSFSYYIMMAGIILFAFAVFFSLVTLPVEFDASRRALRAISDGNILTEEELRGAKKTLSAAAMTYVAAAAVSFVQLLRLILLFGGRGRRRQD